MSDANTLAIGAFNNDGKAINAGHVRAYSTLYNAGVSENSFWEDLRVFPNPTLGDLNLDLGAICYQVRITVYNAVGQVVLNESFNHANALQFRIPGQPGIYVVEVMSEDKLARFRVNKS
jgi:hypothetical protein